MDVHKLAGLHYGFSAKRIEDLGAAEYTLGLIVVDVSGSVAAFEREIEACVKSIVRSCRAHPRADNMMLRLVLFDDKVSEVHGYKPLTECNEDDYTGAIRIGGMTALYDAVCNGVRSATQYGKSLTTADFDVNAAVFVITDGADNASNVGRAMVKDAFTDAVKTEALESVLSILIGVNTDDSDLSGYLQDFKDEAGFSELVSIAEATHDQLAKLGGYVASSMSMQSMALGSGGPSKPLLF